MFKKKYKIVTVKNDKGQLERRIKALRDGHFFSKGDIGAIIDEDSSLSQEDDSWADKTSMLVNTYVFGDLHIVGSKLTNCRMGGFYGNISYSEVNGIVTGSTDFHTNIGLRDSKILVAEKCELLHSASLKMVQSTIRCMNVSITGSVAINRSTIGDTEAKIFDLHNLRINNSDFKDSELPKATMVDGCYLFSSKIRGPARLSNCSITNSIIDYHYFPRCVGLDAENASNTSYSVDGANLAGSYTVCHADDDIHMLGGITISDMAKFDLGDVIMVTNDDAIVARVPGRQWYIELVSNNYFDRKTKSIPGITDDSLIGFLNSTKTDDSRLAKSLIELCITACRKPEDYTIKWKLIWLYATFGIRTRIKKLFSL